MYIMCIILYLFNALSRREGTWQISIIIITIINNKLCFHTQFPHSLPTRRAAGAVRVKAESAWPVHALSSHPPPSTKPPLPPPHHHHHLPPLTTRPPDLQFPAPGYNHALSSWPASHCHLLFSYNEPGQGAFIRGNTSPVPHPTPPLFAWWAKEAVVWLVGWLFGWYTHRHSEGWMRMKANWMIYFIVGGGGGGGGERDKMLYRFGVYSISPGKGAV